LEWGNGHCGYQEKGLGIRHQGVAEKLLATSFEFALSRDSAKGLGKGTSRFDDDACG
jgi:hypothetical protein